MNTELELDALWGFDGEEPEIKTDDNLSDDDDQDKEELVDDEPEQDDEPEPKKAQRKPKVISYDRFAEVVSEKNELKSEIQALSKEFEGAFGVKQLLDNKVDVSLDERLKQVKLNPDSYFTDDDKESALADKLERIHITQRLEQQEEALQFNHTVSQISEGIAYMEETDPSKAESMNHAIGILVNNQSFFVKQRNPSISNEQAQAVAYKEVVKEVSARSLKTGEHPASIAVKLGAELASALGIDISPKNKDLQSTKKDSSINHQNREQSQKRAGRPAIDAAPKASIKIDDDAAALFASF